MTLYTLYGGALLVYGGIDNIVTGLLRIKNHIADSDSESITFQRAFISAAFRVGVTLGPSHNETYGPRRSFTGAGI